jgi:hypothetical protein
MNTVVPLSVLLITSSTLGCGAGFGVGSFFTPHRQPVIHSAVHRLPPQGTRVAVIDLSSSGQGGSRAESEATLWLLQRGLVVVERAGIDKALREQRFTLAHDTSSVLRAGELLGASQMVFVETSLSSADLRSVDIQSGQILWQVTAQYQQHCATMSQWSGLQYHCFSFNLIRPALASVWQKGSQELSQRQPVSQ